MFTGRLFKEHDLIDCSYASDCLEKREKVQKCPLAVPLACSYLFVRKQMRGSAIYRQKGGIG